MYLKGDCNKTHSDKLKKEYQDAYDKGLANYEQEWLNTMNEFIDDCDKRIKIAQQKLEKSPEDRKMGELVFLFFKNIFPTPFSFVLGGRNRRFEK